jgi:hypothetical protein
MAKIQKISKEITPFAGVFYVNDEFTRPGLGKLIDNQLGFRSSTCGYSYSNIFRNFFNLFLSGGECAEDIQQHYRLYDYHSYAQKFLQLYHPKNFQSFY